MNKKTKQEIQLDQTKMAIRAAINLKYAMAKHAELYTNGAERFDKASKAILGGKSFNLVIAELLEGQ